MFSREKVERTKTKKDKKCEEENPCQSEEGALAWGCLWQRQRTR